MQSGRIKNAAITASSQWDKNHASWLARLGNMRRGRLMGAWSAKKNNYNQWIQVDLHRSMKVTGLATQGRYEAAQWVTAFYVLYSADGVKFAKVKNWWDVVKVSVSLNYRVICVYFCVLDKVCRNLTMDPYVSLGGRLEPLRDQLRKLRGKQSICTSSLFPLCPRILGYTIHALKDLVQAKQLLYGGLVSKASGDFVPEVWDRSVGV